VAGSQKVRQREVTYEGTRRGIYDSITVLVGPGEVYGLRGTNTSVNDKSTSKGSAKRRQGRWKGKRPCMIIATSEGGTFFTSGKEKPVEQKACISFFLFLLSYAALRVLFLSLQQRPEK